jgi:hypothetical protein
MAARGSGAAERSNTEEGLTTSRESRSPMAIDNAVTDNHTPTTVPGVEVDNTTAPDEHHSVIAQEASNPDDGLSSDESTNMDSEDYDSDEDMDDTDDNDNNEGSDDDEEQSVSSEDPGHSNSLWALFSAKEKKALGLPTPVTSAEENLDDREDDQAYIETEEHKSLVEEITEGQPSTVELAPDGDVTVTEAATDHGDDDTAPIRAAHSLLDPSAPGTPAFGQTSHRTANPASRRSALLPTSRSRMACIPLSQQDERHSGR